MPEDGCIRHPSNCKFLIRRIYLVETCESVNDSKKASIAETCAELISNVFEYHTNYPYANKIFKHLMETVRRKTDKNLIDTQGWLPFSIAYMHELLFYSRGRNQIIDALKRLEEKGLISSNCPEEISGFYSQNVSWFRLEVARVNALADAVQTGVEFDDAPERKEPSREAKPVKRTLDVIAKEIATFHEHINQKDGYIYDRKRIKMIRDIYRESRQIIGDDKAFAQCLLVILVNAEDDFYQGRSGANKEGKIYDWIENIFRERRQFDVHLNKADHLGLNEQIALAEFEVFKSGGVSRYSKKAVKDASKASQEQKAVLPALTSEEISRYREFARKICGFFVDDKPAAEVLETCFLDDDLNAFGETLTDGEALRLQIEEATRLFTETLSHRQLTNIKEFALEYANNNLINLEE